MREQEREVTGVAGVQELQNKTIRLQFFVPEGHMIVARRFIAGSVITRPASRRDARIPPLMRQGRGSAFAKLNRFSHRNFDRPKGHTDTANALNAESVQERSLPNSLLPIQTCPF
jgi:hypothetical protein